MSTGGNVLPLGVSRWTVAFILLGGAIAWLLHLLLAYGIAEFGTLSGLRERQWGPVDAVSLLLGLLSGAMVMLAGAALAVSWRHRALTAREPSPGDEASATVRFCARFGVITNLAFLVIVIVQTIPIFFFVR